MKVECPYGHVYEFTEEPPKDWPKGAPVCPLCCKNWIYGHPNWSYIEKLKQMSKVSRILGVHRGENKDN